MQTEQTLLDLGFQRHPDWDFTSTDTKNFRKEMPDGSVFRAYVVDCNGPEYVRLGKVVSPSGLVSGWRDCCSNGSVARKISSV